MTRFAGFALALLLAIAAAASADASAQEQKCTTPVANAANPGCGDAYRGMVLYGQVPAPGIPYTWACNQCHSNNPLTDTINTPAPAPSLIRAAPRDPGYIDFMMYKQPEAAPIILAMEGCCISDRPPDNAMGDLGDLAEFLYTCKMGIDPCVAGGGGGSGGTTPGELQGSGSMAFGSKAVGSTSAPLVLTLTNVGSANVNISGVTNSNAADFTIAANTCAALSQTATCGISVTFHPTAAGARSATVTVTSDGLSSPQSFTFTGTGVAGVATHEGMWWNPSEDGWGINLEHQGDIIFATWFTYDASGKAWWLVMIAYAGPGNTYTGKIYTTTGSSYLASAFSKGTPHEAGSGVLTFADAGHATFAYTVNGAHQTKSIVPQQFGTLRRARTARPRTLRARQTTRACGGTRAKTAGESTLRTRGRSSSRPGSRSTSTARHCGSSRSCKRERAAKRFPATFSGCRRRRSMPRRSRETTRRTWAKQRSPSRTATARRSSTRSEPTE
jgi:hypothetical protein